MPGAGGHILGQLAAVGLIADEPPQWQSRRSGLYRAALERLHTQGDLYPCSCSRSTIERYWTARGATRPHGGEWPYPGQCRNGCSGPPRALRVRVAPGVVHWLDRRLGAQRQDVAACVGDFVVQRADGVFSYQLAVVVDDAAQGVSHIVRGADLADNTARQIRLQQRLGKPRPAYLHVPLVVDATGAKLSKQQGAPALTGSHPVGELHAAGHWLGLRHAASNVDDWLAAAVAAWPGALQPLQPPEAAVKLASIAASNPASTP